MAQAKIKGKFITFEGPEGSGKSTHAKKIFDHLTKLGYDCVLTREPGGTFVGEKIREILLNPENKNISLLTETFLFETARSQIVQEVIRPALAKGKIVLCDRFSDSTISYQGYAGDVPIKDILLIDEVATGGVKPDLTILLDVDPQTGLARAALEKQKDRMESRPMSFHKKVRDGYLDLAKKYPERIKVVKVQESVEKTQELIKHEVIKVVM